MSSVYFGGSRHLGHCPQLRQVVSSVVSSGQSIHVGCQLGADAQVSAWSLHLGAQSSLVVFAVAPAWQAAPRHVQLAQFSGAQVVFGAGGTNPPVKAQFLLRSIAAFQGCSQAVFFSPGPGSLAVAREAVAQGLPVFAFGELPAPIPQQAGQWVPGSFMGFACWQWSSAQLVLF